MFNLTRIHTGSSVPPPRSTPKVMEDDNFGNPPNLPLVAKKLDESSEVELVKAENKPKISQAEEMSGFGRGLTKTPVSNEPVLKTEIPRELWGDYDPKERYDHLDPDELPRETLNPPLVNPPKPVLEEIAKDFSVSQTTDQTELDGEFIYF